jgi:assimilatory nitrate reductase catalytic subunit
VSEQAVRDVLTVQRNELPEAQLAAVQAALKCGTNCGSCVPELRRLIRQQAELATA